MTDEFLYLWTAMLDEVSSFLMEKILDVVGGREKLWNASEDEVHEALLEVYKGNEDLALPAKRIIYSRNSEKIIEYSNELKRRNIKFIYPGHEDYPERLFDIPDYPQGLFARGDIEILKNLEDRGVAIVGSRKATSYGRSTCYKMAYDLAKNNRIVISGLAFGIDATAHKGAIDAGGKTIGVLGCGIDICYPQSNIEIFADMCENHVVISEYGLGVTPMPFRFPFRNRIISGLSNGVLVVEAKKKSGSLITADQALEQGREVYAVPGRITDANSVGTNELIKQGAYIVTSAEDILGIEADSCSEKSLASYEKMVYSCVRLDMGYVEDIQNKLKLNLDDILETLEKLEKKGYVKQIFSGYYGCLK